MSLVVRAWPLEWVNGAPLDVGSVAAKVTALRNQLGVADFDGFQAAGWPSTTIGALNLEADAYTVGAGTGLAVSLSVRAALFEHGRDIGDPSVLADIARQNALDPPSLDAGDRVRRDFARGKERGVLGSPHFFVDDRDFFCPSLDIGHDDDGALTATFDTTGMDEFLAEVTRLAS